VGHALLKSGSSLWNLMHNTHHGLVGNLSKRSANPELWTLTVNEYKNSSLGKKIMYRIVRSNFMRLIVTPALWIIAPRIPLPRFGIKICTSVILHDVIYGIVLYFIIINNLFFAFVVIYLIPVYMFNFLASIFLYLQHQYDGTVWEAEGEWDLYKGSIHASSHLVVGKLMGWISGHVGCHHIHHLNTNIPHYNLYTATEDANQYLDVKPIYLTEIFHHLNCVLWDVEAKKMVPFSAINK